MIHTLPSPATWAAEGTQAAQALEDVTAALVIGRDADVAATVAVALARADRDRRSVAIGDLVGGVALLRGAPGAPGLGECFRDALPVSVIAQPVTGEERVFVLPSGSIPVAERLILESSRWPRLIAGFREADALLLLVAAAGTPGLDALMAEVDGVVAVDLPRHVIADWPLLATVERPSLEVSPAMPEPTRGAATGGRGQRPRLALAIAAAALLVTVGAVTFTMRSRHADANAGGVRPEPPPEKVHPTFAQAGGAERPTTIPRAATADTITLGAIVNPGDSSRAAMFALELVAANTLAGANSRLAMRGFALPAPTLAPVLLGSDGRPWFRAFTGAWRDRSEADAFLAMLRDRGLVRQNVGRVVRAPYALLLANGMRPGEVATALAQWKARGIPAYALVQEDGRVRIYAGAFETPGQSVLLALSLRDIGERVTVALRTGRTS